MKWITRKNVKVDRVNCSWLIKNVDSESGILATVHGLWFCDSF